MPIALWVPPGLLLTAGLVQALGHRGESGQRRSPLVPVIVLGAILAGLRLWFTPRWEASGSWEASGFSLLLGLMLTIAFGAMVFVLWTSGRDRWLEPRWFLLASIFVLLVSTRDLLWILLGLSTAKLVDGAGGQRRLHPLELTSSLLFFLGLGVLVSISGAVELSTIASRLHRAPTPGSASGAAAVGMIAVSLVAEWVRANWRAWSLPREQAPLAGFVSLGWLTVSTAGLMRVTAWLGGATPFWPGLVAGLGSIVLVVGVAGWVMARELRASLRSLVLVQGAFVLIGTAAGTAGLAPALFTLSVTFVLVLGALVSLEQVLGEGQALGPFDALTGARGLAAFGLSLVLVSIASTPATAGFVGKLWIWEAALAAGQRVSFGLSLVSGIPLAWICFRLLLRLWSPPRTALPELERSASGRAVLLVTLLLVTWQSLVPEPWMRLVHRAAAQIF